jgi:hypothetical protein
MELLFVFVVFLVARWRFSVVLDGILKLDIVRIFVNLFALLEK